MKHSIDMTRMYLLNSQVRGAADALIPEQEFASEAEGSLAVWNAQDTETEDHASWNLHWQGIEETHQMFRESYE